MSHAQTPSRSRPLCAQFALRTPLHAATMAAALGASSIASAQGQVASMPVGSADGRGPTRLLPLVQAAYAPLGNEGFGMLSDGSVIGWGSGATVPSNLPPARKVQPYSALLVDGSIRFWGTGTQPPSGITDYIDFSVSFHGHGVRSNGTVVSFGELSFLPPPPSDLNAITKVSCGGYHSMFLRTDGTVQCWGQNTHLYSGGQCDVPGGLAAVTAIAAGGYHSMALRADGTVVCWGSNWMSKQPNYAAGQSTPPAGLTGVKAIAAGGYHSLALRENGQVVCWGANAFVDAAPPPSGVGISYDSNQSIPPASANGAVLLAAGEYNSLALKADGSTVGWGIDVVGGRSPSGTLSGVTKIELGYSHGIAMLQDGTLRCWGSNSDGFFGYAGQCDMPANLGTVISFSAGFNHSMAARTDGTVVCWGANEGKFQQYLGQCVVPAGLSGVVAVSAGRCHSMALRSNGTVACWGAGTTVGSPGNPHQYGQSIVPSGLSGVTRIAAGDNLSQALRSNGQITVWGTNTSGELSVPSAVQGSTTAIEPLMALRSNGTVVCWGPTLDGICFGTSANGSPILSGASGQAVQILGQTLTNVVAISSGLAYRAALRSDGSVVAWGFEASSVFPSAPIPGIAQAAAGTSGLFPSYALFGSTVSGCANPQGAGSGTLATNGATWQDINVWNWSNGFPHVPGGQSSVDLGAYGSVGSLCAARTGTFTARPGSTLLVSADLTQPASSNQMIDVTTSAALAGRVWLLGSGASVLPANLSIDVIATPSFSGSFDIVQSNLPAPPGKFLTIIPTSSFAGDVTFRLVLLDLPGGDSLTGGETATAQGAAIAAETMDLNGDGFDDLALAIDLGPSQNGIVQVLLNDGQGNLDGTVSVLADAGAPSPTSIATGDANGDGRDDLVVGLAGNNTAKLFLGGGSGNGTLTGSTVYTASGTPLSVLIIPSESGGPGEVVVGTTGTTNRISTYAASSGTPNQQVVVQPAPRAIGRRGRIVGTGGSTTTTVDEFMASLVNENGAVVVLTPDALGNYSVTQTIPIPGKPVHLDFADIDGDGFAEIITANDAPVPQGAGIPLPVLTLLRGSASGLGNPIPIAPTGATRGLDVTLVDGDADGTLDIASVHRTSAGASEATIIEVDVPAPGGALSLGEETELDAAAPILCARGDLDALGGEDLYLVDSGGAAALDGSLRRGAGSIARPFKGVAPKLPPCPGDLDGSGEIDGKDLAALLNAWGTNDPTADIGADGSVGANDLAILLSNWGFCSQ